MVPAQHLRLSRFLTLFAAGRYLHQAMREAGACKFARKTVVLDSREIDTLLAIPL